jgi:hypothetical protein
MERTEVVKAFAPEVAETRIYMLEDTMRNGIDGSVVQDGSSKVGKH